MKHIVWTCDMDDCETTAECALGEKPKGWSYWKFGNPYQYDEGESEHFRAAIQFCPVHSLLFLSAADAPKGD